MKFILNLYIMVLVQKQAVIILLNKKIPNSIDDFK